MWLAAFQARHGVILVHSSGLKRKVTAQKPLLACLLAVCLCKLTIVLCVCTQSWRLNDVPVYGSVAAVAAAAAQASSPGRGGGGGGEGRPRADGETEHSSHARSSAAEQAGQHEHQREEDEEDEALRLVMGLDEEYPSSLPLDLDDNALRKAASLMGAGAGAGAGSGSSPSRGPIQQQTAPYTPLTVSSSVKADSEEGDESSAPSASRHASSSSLGPVMFPSDDILRQLSAVSFHSILVEIQQFLDTVVASNGHIMPGVLCSSSLSGDGSSEYGQSGGSAVSHSATSDFLQVTQALSNGQTPQIEPSSPGRSLGELDLRTILPDIVNSVSDPPPAARLASNPNPVDGRGVSDGIGEGRLMGLHARHEQMAEADRMLAHLTDAAGTQARNIPHHTIPFHVYECLLIDFMCAGLFGLCWIATKLKKDLLCCFVCCVPDDEDEDDEGENVLHGLSHHHHSDSSRPVKRRKLDDLTASQQSQHTVGTPVQSPEGNGGSHVYNPPTALSSPSGHNLAPNATSLSISHGINIQHPSHNQHPHQLTPNMSASQNHSQSHSGGDESSMFRAGASSEVMAASSYYTHAMMIQMQQQREHQQPQQHYQQQRMQQQHQHQPLMADQPSVESLAVLSVGAGRGREEREVDDSNTASAADAAAMVVNSVDEMLRDIDCSEADSEDTSQPPDHFSIAMI
jgi:hypothetical protein